MAGEGMIVVAGNATADGELRTTPSGATLCAFTLAVTPRVKQGTDWVDGSTTFYRCTAWRGIGENAADTVKRGMRLLVHGRFQARTYEKDGQERTSLEIDVEDMGPSLKYSVATTAKAGSAAPAATGWGDPSEPSF